MQEKTIFYSDNFIINENENGFVVSFIKDKTDIEGVIDYGFGIGMSPLSAKEFLFALYTAIGEYEEKYGQIKINSDLLTKIIAEKTNPIGFELIKSEEKK